MSSEEGLFNNRDGLNTKYFNGVGRGEWGVGWGT